MPLSFAQDLDLCPGQDFTFQGYFKAAQLNDTVCYIQMCVIWGHDGSNESGGQCADAQLNSATDYIQLSGTYPANTDSNRATEAVVYLNPSCHQVNYQAPGSGILYMDDIVMINNAYPQAAALPTANPTPTTACASVSITPNATGTGGGSNSGGSGSNGGGSSSGGGSNGGSSCPKCTIPQSLQNDVFNLGNQITGLQYIIQGEMDNIQSQMAYYQQQVSDAQANPSLCNINLVVAQSALSRLQSEQSVLSILQSTYQRTFAAFQKVQGDVSS